MLGTSNRTPQAMPAASPFCTAPKSLVRETLEVAGLVGGSPRHRAVELLSNRGTVVPNRGDSDSSSECILCPDIWCPRFPGLGLRRSRFSSRALGCSYTKCPESQQSTAVDFKRRLFKGWRKPRDQGLDTLLI